MDPQNPNNPNPQPGPIDSPLKEVPQNQPDASPMGETPPAPLAPQNPTPATPQVPEQPVSPAQPTGQGPMQPQEAIAPKPKEGEPYDVLIIGSGPAGLTAATYTTRAALSTLIVAGAKWGGQLMLTTEVENYPGFPEGILGPDLMLKMRQQAERFGAVVIEQDAESVDLKNRPFTVNADSKSYKARSVIVATGADTLWLGLPSEQKFIGRGISSCAPCDAPFFRNKNVIVVGGGDSAMEEALVLTKYATSVTIVHRRDKFKASEIMQKRVLSNPKIKVLWNTIVADVRGDDRVREVHLASVVKQQPPIIADPKMWSMPIDGIFVAIGHAPSTKIFAGQIGLDQKGYVIRGQDARRKTQDEGINGAFQTATNVDGVFIAGDVHDYHYKQAVTAAGFGCMAAMDAEKWIEERKAFTP